MFWLERIIEQARSRFANEIQQGIPLIIRDEKTMSGRVHVGSLRGVVIHGAINEALTEANIASRYLFEINDYDVMDGLPVYLDADRYSKYMGQLLCDVPSPEPTSVNYAEYWAAEFMQAIAKTGYAPTYYRSSDYYRQGKYNTCIQLALDHANDIRRIYQEVSGSVKPDDWLPLQVICEQCAKVGTTKVIAWDGTNVTYRCEPSLVTWATGCGHQGTVSPFDGRGKLPWKVEWAAKFVVLGVHIEGGGKDHYTKGGSREVARRIVTEVFKHPEPIDVPYNFFVVGGKKMSSSKGKGATASEIASILPTPVLRLLLMRDPKREIDFDIEGETIPLLFDQFDSAATSFESKIDSDEAVAFPYLYLPKQRHHIPSPYRPRFSIIAYLVQMPHIEMNEKIREMKGSDLSTEDVYEMGERVEYARRWVTTYGPEKYKFEIQETIPELALFFSKQQREALDDIRRFLLDNHDATGEGLHAFIHDVKSRLEITPADLFGAIYLSFLGKSSGPQAGWFLTALDRSFVLERLHDVVQQEKR